MRVIIAARLSQEVGEGQQGLDFQDEDARDWAESSGHNVIGVTQDFKSGTSAMWDRPNLKPWVTEPALLAKYDGIVAYAFDRLSRQSAKDERALRQWAEDNGKTLFIVEDKMQWPPSADWDAERIQDENKSWNDAQDRAHRDLLKTSRRYKNMQRGKIRRNSITGRPNYGYRIITVEDGRKTQTPVKPEADYMIEAKDRYLDGETLDAIVADFMVRGIPAPGKSTKEGKTAKWSAKTLSAYLRNSAYSGIRVNAKGVKVHYGYTPLWSPNDTKALQDRIKSRAHRQGISPKNVALLTSILFDANGHPMYRINKWATTAYYCRVCHTSVDLTTMDNRIHEMAARDNTPYLITEVFVSDHENLIHKLRAEREALDDTNPDDDARDAELKAEIRRLSILPPTRELVTRETGQTYAERYASQDDAQRRDDMLSMGMRIVWLGEGNWEIHTGSAELSLLDEDGIAVN